MVKALVASRNQGKVRELEQVLRELNIDGVELVSLNEAPAYPDPIEDGLSFAENALLKARAGAKATGLACVADDSGLTVEALNGMPGILSARWSGGTWIATALSGVVPFMSFVIEGKRRKEVKETFQLS